MLQVTGAVGSAITMLGFDEARIRACHGAIAF
jgi:hypothetical protein